MLIIDEYQKAEINVSEEMSDRTCIIQVIDDHSHPNENKAEITLDYDQLHSLIGTLLHVQQKIRK